jgi:membrane protein DedA with SNARE-associated domain
VAHALTLAIHLRHHVHGPRLDYVGLAVAAAISWVGLPGPGEAALIAAGIAASRGRLDLVAAVAAAWGGATAGGTAGWLIGHYGGRRVVLAGRWLRHQRERALERGRRFYDRYGWFAVYFAPSWVAGINAMSARRFLPANAVCALVWALVIGVGSYVIGPSASDLVSDIGLVGSVAIVLTVVTTTVLARRRVHR